MKQLICLFLIFSLLLCGCSSFGERIKEPATFYYLCGQYQKDLCCVILTEEREASGHTDDLSYLLALYLMGPVSEECRSPLPSGTTVESIVYNANALTIELSDLDKTLSDAEFSLAGACLTMTCLDIVPARNVTVISGTRSVTMNQDSLSLFDSSGADPQKEITK